MCDLCYCAARAEKRDDVADSSFEQCKFETDPLPLGSRFHSDDFKVLYRQWLALYTAFIHIIDVDESV